MTLTFAFLFGYLLGSIPFGLLLTRIAGAPDVRTIGSGNIGATNVLRTGRKGLAAATLLLDMSKGMVAVVMVMAVAGNGAVYAAALGAFLGHLFPAWLKFKGGKGVATYIGVLLGLYWPCALIFCAIWLAVAFAFRYSSLAALAASALTPLVLFLLGKPGAAALFLVLSALLWIMHRANIVRLLAGTEGKIGATTSA